MGINMWGKIKPPKITEKSLELDSEIKKKKKTKANFDNLFPTTKCKAWEWKSNEGMFGSDIFE